MITATYLAGADMVAVDVNGVRVQVLTDAQAATLIEQLVNARLDRVFQVDK